MTDQVRFVFLGRTEIAGIEPGAWLRGTGRAGERRGRLEIINPAYELLKRADDA